MWISKTIAQRGAGSGSAADMGMTTIGGGSASVMTRGEQRDLARTGLRFASRRRDQSP